MPSMLLRCSLTLFTYAGEFGFLTPPTNIWLRVPSTSLIPSMASFVYVGQLPAGFFFCRDCFMASCHLPRIFSTSGLGPRLAPDLAAGTRFAAFLVAIWTAPLVSG